MPAIIQQFLTLTDNFAVLVHDLQSGATAAIDAPEAAPISAMLKQKGWRLTDILVTHRHHDHTDGILALKQAYGCKVTGGARAAQEIPGLDVQVREGDTIKVGNQSFGVWETPGHCHDHISFLLARSSAIFVGDTMFTMGCGRIFDSTPEQMLRSLERIASLPDDTTIYHGHEYTLSNARFALAMEPENRELAKRAAEVEQIRAAGHPTGPTTIKLEKATNPFLRTNSPAIRKTLGMEDAPALAVFTELRERKNRF